MSIDEAKIKGRVGRRTKFTYPGSEGTRRGTLTFREIARSAEGVTGAWYCTVVDVITFDERPEPWLRVGYYRQPAGATATRWASQTTICSPFSEWRDDILPAIKKLMEEAGSGVPALD